MNEDLKAAQSNDGWPGIVSRFQLVVIAGLRSKQLFHGARPRIEAGSLKRKNTGIALEELKRGLIRFSVLSAPGAQKREVELIEPARIMDTPIVQSHRQL